MNETEFLQNVTDTAVKLLRNRDVFEDILQEIYGGKMIRPRTIYALASSLDGTDISRFIPLATTTELVHLASLFHDDVIDNGKIRRDRPTLNARYGNLISILAGDYFYSSASRLVLENYGIDVAKIYSYAVSYMTLMELKQALFRWNTSLNRDDYFDIIRGKTGALFSASFEAVAIISGLDDSETLHMREAGMLFGEIFQLTDDLLDFIGSKTGKSRFKDLLEGDITLPTILLMNSDDEFKNLVLEYFQSRGEKRELIEKAEPLLIKRESLRKNISDIINKKKREIESHLGVIENFNLGRFIPLINEIVDRQK
ncbi:MAG: polyprenyl synthetase family protein [Myxococcota bacterium]